MLKGKKIPNFQHTFTNTFSMEGFMAKSYYTVELNITFRRKKTSQTTKPPKQQLNKNYLWSTTTFLRQHFSLSPKGKKKKSKTKTTQTKMTP